MILKDNEIRELCQADKPLIAEAVEFDKQLQPCGFDLSVMEVYKFNSAGQLDFSNEERVLPDVSLMPFKNGWLHLQPGSYKIKTNEIVSIPDNMIAFCQSRSSLLRMGVNAATGFWDAGFSGRGEFVIQVVNPHGIKLKQNARVVQIAFVKLSDTVDKVYSGQYQNLR